ncbi:MAG TPA: class I SAM-dependent methyltransferase, partial [Spirochaetia bacterium]|nr:class I SAM-dependent methyltransferase [Spirochaetia bacterium]
VGDRLKGIAEMTRTTRPGGRVLILEFVPPRDTFFGRLYSWYLRNVMPAIGGVISGFRPSYTYLHSSISEFMQPDEIVKAMQDTGLVDCVAERFTGGIAYLFHGVKPVKR